MSRWSPPPRAERWDRERFERQTRGPVEREQFEDRYVSSDRYGDRYEEDVRYERDRLPARTATRRRSPEPRYEERDRLVVEEKFSRPLASRPRPGRYYDEEGDNLEGGTMVRIERRRREGSGGDDDFPSRPPPVPRAPGRPVFLRRQSSLDTFDRKPMPRYGDRMVREEIIKLPPRRRSPPRFVERDYEEIRVAEPDYWGDDDFRGYKEREIITERTRRRSDDIQEETEDAPQSEFPKRGKTRMPMRLVNERAIIDLGYPFEKEGDVLIILKALGKEHIDEVITLSREYNSRSVVEEVRTKYVVEAPAPPKEKEREERVDRTEIIIDRVERSPSPASTVRSIQPRGQRARSASTSRVGTRQIIIEEDRGTSNTMSVGPLGALIVPDRNSSSRRDKRSIEAEIRALEAEKKALKYEREAEREQRRAQQLRDGGNGEIIIERDRGDSVEIRKDRRGRLSLVR